MHKTRVAVIGCGAISKNHGKALAASEQAELCYCVDIDTSRAETFSRTYGGVPLDDWRHLLEMDDVDAVHICTPHYLHASMAISLLRAGKHVFSEKPMAMTVSEALGIIEEERRTDRYYGVCFQNRLNPPSVEAKHLIDEKRYGSVVSAMALVAWDRHGSYYRDSPWRGAYATEGGGCIINQAIHTLDLLDYLCGGIESLSAFDAKLRDTDDYEVDDSCMVNFSMHNGARAVGYCTNCYPLSKQATVEIHCERATLTVKQSGLLIEGEDGSEFHPAETATGEKSEWGLSHGKLIELFYRCIAEGVPFPVDGSSALHAVKIVNAIQHSHGRTMYLDRA